MANKIQIKRSTTNAAPTGLANGELAYTSNGEILFVGHPDGSTGSVPIGGKRFPGVLTANQALVANSSSLLDKIWLSTEVLVGANVDLTTSALLIGNSTVNSTVNSTLVQVANSTSTANLTATSLAIGANASLSTSTLFLGNSTVNSTHTAALLQVSNSTSTSNLTATQLNIGANVFANTSAFDVGNTIITSALLTLGGQINANGGVGTAGQILTSGAAGNVYWGAAPSGVTDLTDSADATTVTILSSTGTDAVLESANVSAAGILTSADWVKLNGITAGATTYDLLAVANTEANKGIIRLDGANTSVANDDILIIGANGVVVSSNSTAILITGQIDTDTTYDLLSVANTTQGVIRLDPSAGANDDVLFIGQDEISITSNSTAVYVDHADVARSDGTSTASPAFGGTFTAVDGVTTNARGHVTAINVKTVTLPTPTDTNTTYDLLAVANTEANKGILRLDPSSADANDDVFFVGSNGIVVTSNSTAFTISTDSAGTGTFNNLTVSGNLEVNGTLSTFNVNNVVVEDSMIALASNNTADTLDIGFYGKFGASATYSGLFRDASATDKSYKLFTGAIPEPGTTVDTANVNFAYANLTLHSLLGGNASSTIDLFTIDGGTF